MLTIILSQKGDIPPIAEEMSMVIISQAQVQPTKLQTPWGVELAVSFMNQHFVPTQIFYKQEEAVLACRRDLDAGLFSILVQGDQELVLCCPLPPEIATLAA